MKNIKAVLARIHKELQRAEDANTEAREILQGLNRDVEQLEEAGDTEIESIVNRARQLESRFAANHPVLEQTARELADAIAKMGV
jgi:1,6-anhydro-N-acetylmuramate kinase